MPFVMKEPNWIWEANIEDTREELVLANKVPELGLGVDVGVGWGEAEAEA